MPEKLYYLKERASMLQKIREFFAERDVLEVETPILSSFAVTDVHLESFSTEYRNGSEKKTYYLQTSPEYSMKRLLAEGSGPIFQICKTFRNQGESGRLHNPEFTMLEWYRPGFNHHDLMHEMDELLQTVSNCKPAIKKSYQELFFDYLKFDCLSVDLDFLQQYIKNSKVASDSSSFDKDTCLQWLLAQEIEPHLGFDAPLFIYDFPASQAALSKIRNEKYPVAERFEVYIQGLEIANGFHELTNADEQLKRFQNDQKIRKVKGLTIPEIDNNFIQALKKGIPNCAGVALGIDRLLMINTKMKDIKKILSFPWDSI